MSNRPTRKDILRQRKTVTFVGRERQLELFQTGIHGAFKELNRCLEFRQELEAMREELVPYVGCAVISKGVEVSTNLEN